MTAETGHFYEDAAVIGGSIEWPRTKMALSLACRLPARRILDLGSGEGEASVALAKATGAQVVCADISELAVRRCRDRGFESHLVQLGHSKLPFSEASFDLVYMTEVIEHLANPDGAIEEVRRILRPGGHLVLSTPNLACLPNRALLLLGVQPLFSEVSLKRVLGRRLGILGQGGQPVGHLRLYTKSSLIEFLRLHDFSEIRVRGSAFHSAGPLGLIERAAGLVPSIAMIFVVTANRPGEHAS
jgi:ubiquinone/menaquinone biosynthesis C-methylase UbiE